MTKADKVKKASRTHLVSFRVDRDIYKKVLQYVAQRNEAEPGLGMTQARAFNMLLAAALKDALK